MSMKLEVYRHRAPLKITYESIGKGSITIGFIGGSITDARKFHGNWPETVIHWMAERYEGLRIQVENAAISATGSDLAVFRAERDLIAKGCDLVFVEFAVNDDHEPKSKRMRTREGLIRKLLEDRKREIVLVYMYNQNMYEDMTAGRLPPSIEEFEQLAEHYGIGSAWAGLHALEEVKRGRMRFEEWLPDGLHPEGRGSFSYGSCVTEFLAREEERYSIATGPDSARKELPAPIAADHWGEARVQSLDTLVRKGIWSLRRWPYLPGMEQVLYTSSIGSKLALTFHGSALYFGFDFGKQSAEFRYRIDDGEWLKSNRERPGWCGDRGWFVLNTIAEGLEPKEHRCEVEVIHGNRADCEGTQFCLALVGVLP
ncbi:SGNH/GDSL hydrolase family protein [Cohnella suwonensis]|uniref:SGNH/GDSL hydrolase family protein n=1 Tax=Cohnella suwonensis TaxID=696072 RepID=A0ABW0LT81_9BACL